MHLPRLAMFRSSNGIPVNHLVTVDENGIMKYLCIRHEAKHGTVLDIDAKLTCTHCKKKGWAKHARTPAYSTASIT